MLNRFVSGIRDINLLFEKLIWAIPVAATLGVFNTPTAPGMQSSEASCPRRARRPEVPSARRSRVVAERSEPGLGGRLARNSRIHQNRKTEIRVIEAVEVLSSSIAAVIDQRAALMKPQGQSFADLYVAAKRT